MKLEDVQPTERESFKLGSGKLLVFDPYYMGYPKEVEDEIERSTHREEHGENGGVVYLPRGVIYYYPEDSFWNVYRTEKGLWIANDNNGRDKDNNGRDKTKEYLLTASSDICTLIIGNQEVFGLNEDEFDFLHKVEYLDEEKKHGQITEELYKVIREKTLRHSRLDAIEINEKVTSIQSGEYSCQIKPDGLEVNRI